MNRPARTLTLLFIALATLVFVIACTKADTAVRQTGKVPYYTSIEDAKAAAIEGQLIAVEFYSDW